MFGVFGIKPVKAWESSVSEEQLHSHHAGGGQSQCQKFYMFKISVIFCEKYNNQLFMAKPNYIMFN